MRLAHHSMTWSGWWKKQNQPFDIDQLIRELKEAGYHATELRGSEAANGPASALQKKLRDNGVALGAWATSVTANPWHPNTEQYRRDMDYAASMGLKTIMVCGGFLPEPRRNAFDSDYELFASNLDAACEYAKKNGQEIAYHPHTGCLVETIAETQRLLNYLPDLKLCVDTGHLAAVRNNPAEFVRTFGKKVIHTHLKDWDPEKRAFAELGEGKAGLDFRGFFDALNASGYDGWIVVERDNTPIPAVESAKISRKFLDRCLSVE